MKCTAAVFEAKLLKAFDVLDTAYNQIDPKANQEKETVARLNQEILLKEKFPTIFPPVDLDG